MLTARRYVPLLGVAYIATIVVLQAWGVDTTQLQTLGGLLQLDQASPVSASELSAAAAALAGVALKFMRVIQQTKAGQGPATPPSQ